MLYISALQQLWFAEKFVSLLIEQHLAIPNTIPRACCDLLKNSYLCLLNNTRSAYGFASSSLWFAEKFVSLLIEQHHTIVGMVTDSSCDLLKNSYLCLLNNTFMWQWAEKDLVVICWKIRIFAYWTTPFNGRLTKEQKLWFAEKFVSLLIEQHLSLINISLPRCCDLLKNSYLCLLNNTPLRHLPEMCLVVICWKIRIFAYWTTPGCFSRTAGTKLWFAEKFVSLLIEQHLLPVGVFAQCGCDLLKNSYLCLLNNTGRYQRHSLE